MVALVFGFPAVILVFLIVKKYMDNGWIKLHRKMRDNSLYSNSKAVHVWIECLFRARHEKKKVYLGRGEIILESGQFAMGRQEFGKSIGISGSTAWFWILDFKKQGMLDIKSGNKGTIITILNWDSHQRLDNKKTATLTAKKQQKNTNKNDKNEKKPLSAKADETKLPLQEKKTTPFDFKTTLDKMRTNVKQKHIQIIALYWNTLEIKYDNEDQYQVQLRRNLKPAQMLKGYTFQDIKATMEYLETETDGGQKFKWTLETVLKYIDEVKQTNEK